MFNWEVDCYRLTCVTSGELDCYGHVSHLGK